MSIGSRHRTTKPEKPAEITRTGDTRLVLSLASSRRTPGASIMQQTAFSTSATQMAADAAACVENGDFRRAIEILERAHRLEPTNSRILLDLGQACTLSYDFLLAEKCFESAVSVAFSKTDALLAAGHHWLRIRNHEAARKCFERILQEPVVPVLIFLRLADIYERQRNVEQALEMVMRALQLDPANTAALFMRARLHRQAGELDDADRLLRAIIAQPNSPVHSPAWHELGALLDQQGRYDEAMAAFLKAKELVGRDAIDAARATVELKWKQASLQHAAENFSEALFKRWQQAGQSELRSQCKLAFLCGHARSGTTLIEYVLDSHPQVIAADETDVLPNCSNLVLGRNGPPSSPLLPLLNSLPARTLRQVRADYFRGTESFLGQAINGRVLIEKNPGLTMDLPVFLRIFPECKYIVALRDPRDVCLSCFMQRGQLVPDSASWLTLEGTIKNYASIMRLWLALKPVLGNIAIEVRYEDTVKDLASQARRVLDFLGCEWDERVLRFDEHTRSKTVCSPTYVEVNKPVYRSAVGRWRNYQNYFEPFMDELAPFLEAFGY